MLPQAEVTQLQSQSAQQPLRLTSASLGPQRRSGHQPQPYLCPQQEDHQATQQLPLQRLPLRLWQALRQELLPPGGHQRPHRRPLWPGAPRRSLPAALCPRGRRGSRSPPASCSPAPGWGPAPLAQQPQPQQRPCSTPGPTTAGWPWPQSRQARPLTRKPASSAARKGAPWPCPRRGPPPARRPRLAPCPPPTVPAWRGPNASGFGSPMAGKGAHGC
mmetsp:Transcript_23664/g.74387  ORF Transcript_23664/g.74387 Transcript_23664/m.74387 type:complete len:217 (-) Transcript_23664:24-674(-)